MGGEFMLKEELIEQELIEMEINIKWLEYNFIDKMSLSIRNMAKNMLMSRRCQ
jgi:hypothetical protein